MSRRKAEPGAQSILARVVQKGKAHGFSRVESVERYVMDRILFRLGRSRHADQFFLKGGLLVGSFTGSPYRFTRDIDLARSHGPPDPDALRQMWRDVVALATPDGLEFRADGVRAERAEHDVDGYDGVKVRVASRLHTVRVDIRLDIGFGDAVVPPAGRVDLSPFLEDQDPARLLAYDKVTVVAEKAQTLLDKFPLFEHRLKDLLDIVMLARKLPFDGEQLAGSVRATFERRNTRVDPSTLGQLRTELRGKKWTAGWASMCREKRLAEKIELHEATQGLEEFIAPVLTAIADGARPPREWVPSTGWES